MTSIQDRKTCRHIWAPIAPKQTAPGLPPSDAEWGAMNIARCEICGASWTTNQQVNLAGSSDDCTVGSCRRHGRCMYLNHPRCPLAQADTHAERRDVEQAQPVRVGSAVRDSECAQTKGQSHVR